MAKLPSAKRETRHDFSVVIPTYNRRAILEQCLQALARQDFTGGRYEVIVVDDGSVDDTAAYCRQVQTPYALRYLYQDNAGAGAARRRGVSNATGKLLLLINDDTIAFPDLLNRHLAAHRKHPSKNFGVLGTFEYPAAARQKAMDYFLGTSPFLFPQPTMKSGFAAESYYFMTCNLSISRDAVLGAGSFDQTFRVGEDSDLGIRLTLRGSRVLYDPAVRAVHQHLNFTVEHLLQRAALYGPVHLKLFRKYPQLVGDGKGLLGRLDAETGSRIRAYLAERERYIPNALEALRQYDHLNFAPLFNIDDGGRPLALRVMDLFATAVPEVYQYHMYRSFLEAWKDNESVDGRDSGAGQTDKTTGLGPAATKHGAVPQAVEA